MNIVQMRRGMGKGLNYPYDHKVEYIASPSAGYINLPIAQNTIYSYDVEFLITATGRTVFSGLQSHASWTTMQIYGTLFNYGGVSDKGNVNVKVHSYTAADRSVCVQYDYGNGSTTYAAKDTSFSPYTTSTATMQVGVSGQLGTRIYSLSFGDANGVKLFDAYPVRKDGKGYLYDKVSKQLYGSVTANSFTYGGDID